MNTMQFIKNVIQIGANIAIICASVSYIKRPSIIQVNHQEPITCHISMYDGDADIENTESCANCTKYNNTEADCSDSMNNSIAEFTNMSDSYN